MIDNTKQKRFKKILNNYSKILNEINSSNNKLSSYLKEVAELCDFAAEELNVNLNNNTFDEDIDKKNVNTDIRNLISVKKNLEELASGYKVYINSSIHNLETIGLILNRYYTKHME